MPVSAEGPQEATAHSGKRNWRVVLQGVAFTEVDMLAADEDEAMRLAEEWARNRTQPEQFNAVDYDGAAWTAHEADLSDDQSVVADGPIGPECAASS